MQKGTGLNFRKKKKIIFGPRYQDVVQVKYHQLIALENSKKYFRFVNSIYKYDTNLNSS